jgi:hypothetical protein
MSATLEQVEQTVQNQPAILQAISDTNAAVKLQGDDIAEIAAILQEQDKRIKALEAAAIPPVINVKDYAKGDGIAYDDDAIMAAQDKALAASLPLYFPAGNYLCRQSRVVIKSGAKWQGEAGARLFTKESSVYNIAFKVADQAKDVCIDGLTFDQMGDIVQTPNGSVSKGCHLFHVGNYENLKFTNNNLEGYGMTLFLTQPFDGWGKYIEVKNNKAQGYRRTNVYYDASLFNIDGLSGVVEGNSAKCVKVSGINDYKLESAFEIHLPKGSIKNNHAANCVNGFLFVGYPTLYQTTIPVEQGLTIQNNEVRQCIRAIALWGDRTVKGRSIANVDISGNVLEVCFAKKGDLSQYYYPTTFIGCVNAGADSGYFKNVAIYDNDMTTAYESGLSLSLLNYAPPVDQVGAINMLSNNQCDGWKIYMNHISFPYTTFNMRTYATALYHNNITIQNNNLVDCVFARAYDNKQPARGFDAVYVMENIKNILAEGNIITGKQPVAMTKYGANVGNATIK